MSKIIYSGLEGSGKSLKLAMKAEEILFRNSKWKIKSGVVRPMAFNFPLSKDFTEQAKDLGIPLLFWENLDDLISFKDCDIFIDEIGTYFDSRLWTELSLDVRRWIQQGSKMGIELFGACQDFSQVDKSFRRLVNELYSIQKLIGSSRPSNTKPPIKKIWGLCMISELNPRSYDEDNKEIISGGLIPNFFFITRHSCELFDTRHFIQRSKPLYLKHSERNCPDCGHEKISHT